ncbi:Ku protein [Streptomyces sp. NPDC049954]|uniref:non-homologous end joining protein Ku n=1 Tax=Streptomyces sp. NPDC049954 TaxID=3155779 RepID=UPI00342B77B2
MRSIWNGAVSFGLVSIPVKLMNATENHTVSFRQIHTEDGGRVRYRKYCELEDEEIPASEIDKAYEDADGTLVPITDEDLAALPVPTAKTIEIIAFVPAERIDPLQMETAYYLADGGASAAKPYTLLREALRRSNRVAVAKFALRGKERLGMLRVVDEVITLHGLLWPDEIRTPEEVAPTEDVRIRDKELDLADALMDTLGEVDMNDLHDDYREAVEEMITARTEGTELPAPERKPGGKVIDLTSALENSVKAARDSRAEDPSDREMAEVHHLEDRKKPPRAAKKTPSGATGKTSAKKGAAKEGPGKKASPSASTARKQSAGRSSSGGTKGGSKKTAAKKSTTAKKTSPAKKTSTARRKAS